MELNLWDSTILQCLDCPSVPTPANLSYSAKIKNYRDRKIQWTLDIIFMYKHIWQSNGGVMTQFNYRELEMDKFKKIFNSISSADILKNINNMSDEQLAFFVTALSKETDAEWRAKLIAVLSGLNSTPALETVGRCLSPNLFLEVLIRKDEINNEKLRTIPPLLVGMDHAVFFEVLKIINNELLGILLQESSTEPLQHQITLFSHEIIYKLEILTQTLRNLEYEIDSFELENITHQTIDVFYHKIGAVAQNVLENIKRISNALAIAWNTNREDLIDSLSFQKECWQKYDTLVIGTPAHEKIPASGLYARLEERLNIIFGNPNDLSDIEALQDNEPAIEALAKFSLWYLHDYWEIGLLPNIPTLEGLDLNEKEHSDRERAEYRASLFSIVQETLEHLGLKTVADLKKGQIFSKRILQEHIEKYLPKVK